MFWVFLYKRKMGKVYERQKVYSMFFLYLKVKLKYLKENKPGVM